MMAEGEKDEERRKSTKETIFDSGREIYEFPGDIPSTFLAKLINGNENV
ncbi:hypothetical protein KSC_003330 [Ktedonobacter sp. SOSP1-52]|nr:hypothetical protein [Ktedonobacter sp. SOSP1-52]GHO61441.1 hypothetical protein KSC_003330 [Ktedonobacter sp. SOSP1-52]